MNDKPTQPSYPNVTFTTFSTAKATAGQRVNTTWPGMCTTLTAPTEHATKQHMPLWRPAVSAGDSRAAGTGVDQVFAVVGDYDGERVTPAEVAERLRNASVMALVHTTASHSPDKPRWRVVAPLTTPIEARELPAYVSLLNGALGGILAPESWEASRGYFFGRVRGVPFERYVVGGVPLDIVLCCADFDPIGKPAKQTRRISSTPGKGGTHAGERDLDRAVALDQVNADTMADLQSALETVGADERSVWIENGIALSSLKGTEFEDEARDLWCEWSRRSPRWRDGDDAQWDTFNATDATHLKVFAIAAENGWQNPRKAALETERERSVRIGREGEHATPTQRAMTGSEMLAELMFIGEGSRVSFVNEPRFVLPLNEFKAFTAGSVQRLKGASGKPTKVHLA